MQLKEQPKVKGKTSHGCVTDALAKIHLHPFAVFAEFNGSWEFILIMSFVIVSRNSFGISKKLLRFFFYLVSDKLPILGLISGSFHISTNKLCVMSFEAFH